ncbi:glucosaminidase domain-containing protein [Aureispira sp. CCB-QB1]|uniref:glucosaminidase domain-containing protein n=1 Tax=Aureispira sp. CCB-QB1 TaxID=1313421 RepID=UPI0012DBE0E0|nr:glucosaminidase domain-containing protein [Aureispira sp. CCB-QB1]
METNNTNNINIQICEDVLVTENTTPTTEELIDLLEVEAQNTETVSETDIVLAKKIKEPQKLSLKYIFQSLFYAMQWRQLKRQMTKEALVGMSKRHWPKAVAVAAVIVLFNLDFGSKTNTNSQASMLMYANYPEPVLETENHPVTPSHMVALSNEAKENYIARFASVAQGEMKKFGIPASVILGLAILHSNYGVSELAQVGHNHFHITCTDNHLAEGITGRGTYENDCYIHYQNAWTSFRANSMKLDAAPFKELKAVAGDDYTIWVSGLQKMGLQETDNLLEIIETHNLYELDKIQ